MGETQEALQFITDQARRLLTDHATPEHLKKLLDQPGAFDRDLWVKTAELGWCAAAIAEQQGGIGLGWEALCQLSEVMGEFTVSLPLLPNTVAANTIFAADQGLGEVAERLLSGDAIATIAITDQDVSGIPTAPVARFADGRISGVKAVTSYAAIADFALVSASAADGAAIVLVDLTAPGVGRDVVNVIDNGRAAAVLSFDNTPATRLDRDGGGASLLLTIAATAAVVTAFEQVGGARVALALAVQYAKERKVFGQYIGAFQAIKHNLANMYSLIEVARGCALDAMAQLESGSPALISYAAAARLGANKAYDYAGKECIQIHGGIGATWEARPHHYYRRARSLALEYGATPFWRDVLVDNVHMMAEGY